MPSTVTSTQYVVNKHQPTALVLLILRGCLEKQVSGRECACESVVSGTSAELCVGGRMST